MNATDRIANEFDGLIAIGPNGIGVRPFAEQVVYYTVATRCEIDINGFESVYEQHLNAAELAVLVEGLNRVGENEVAAEFRRGYELLKNVSFYEHMDWNRVSRDTVVQINEIGRRIGNRLWGIDEKLVTLLDERPQATGPSRRSSAP